MPIWVDPKTGERFENYEPDAAEKAQQFGFVTPEQYEAEQRSGTLAGRAKTVGEEAVRQGAAVADLIPGVDAGAAAPGLTELEPGQVESPLTGVYSPEARERRQVNPASAGLGAAAPALGASILLPGSGFAGLAATIGVDALSGYSQAAVDAELENRDITGEEVLRNAGLNLAFSLPLYGLGEAARAFLQPRRLSALERAAGAAKDTAGRRAAAAEGADLAQAVADPAVQADLLDRVSANAEEAVARSSARIEGLSPPVVARNPRAQRDAVGAIADVTRTANPELAARLDALTKGASKRRLEGLRAIRDELAAAGESETLDAIDATLGREDLWGSRAIRGASDIDAVLGSVPGPGADPESLIEYAARLRKVRDGEFAGMADEIEQLAERQIEIRTASAIGDVTPEAANDVVDYAAAMRNIDPNEAWRLTHDGADEGLRKLESTSVSDALQRVDDVLREDVAMAVKREDFVKGAESWTPAQVAKQSQWATDMRGRAMGLAGKLADAQTVGRDIGGFRAEVTSLIDRAVQNLADIDPVTANYEWDALKRGLDSVADRLASAGPRIDDASKAWGAKTILEFNDALRDSLQDAELWGRNAGLQKETNAAWKALIDPYKRVTKQMAEFLGREFGVVGQAGVRRRFDPDMINSIMSRGYQRNLRKDIQASIKGLDQMMQARQAQGLSHLDRLSQARADLVRIQQGFDFADLLAVAKSKAKAPIGLEVIGRLADTATPGGFMGSVAGPLASRAKGALVGEMPMLKPGSSSPLSAAVRRHLGLTRAEQAAMLADPAFYERLPGSLQKQIMAGSAAGDRAVEMATAAADAAKRDRELTARMMVNPEDAKRAKKAQRKKYSPAIERARQRASTRGMVDLGVSVTKPRKIAVAAENMGLTESELRGFMLDNRLNVGPRDTVVLSELHQTPGIQDFIDRKAIERYTENSAFTVNKNIRQKGWDKSWAYSGASAPEKRYYEGLKGIALRAADVMRRAPPQPLPVMRGTAVSRKQLEDWLRTGVVSDTAFQSFSTDERVARRFIPSENYAGQFAESGTERVLIRSPNGGGYAHGGPEAEVMFPPNTKMRVTGSAREGDVTVIDVEPVATKAAQSAGAKPVSAREWVAAGKRAQPSADTADAVRVYGESGHQGVNAFLRGLPTRKVANDDYFSGIADGVTRHLDEQIAAGNTVPGVVYRGLPADAFPSNLKPGQTWSDPGFLSTTRDLTQAQNFGGKVVLELEQRTGVPFLRKDFAGKINYEQEVLMRPGTEFEVVSDGVRKAPNGQDRRFVRLREKDTAGASMPNPRGGERGMVVVSTKQGWAPKTDLEKLVEREIQEMGQDIEGLEGASLSDVKRRLRDFVTDAWAEANPDLDTVPAREIKKAIEDGLSATRTGGNERGFVDVAEGLAKSPLGVGTGSAGAVVAYHHLAEPEAPDPESMTALERFSDGYDRPSDAFRAARKMILDWQRNPEALVDMIDGHVGEVGQLSPKLQREMTAQAMRIASYLQDNLPGQRNVSVVYPDGTPPSRAEVRQFALRFGAAVDPAGVMADARMGRLERTQLETLQALWPRDYDALRAGVIQELGTGRATPQTRQRMSLLFGFGSEVDPALGPRTRAIVAAARAAQEKAQPAPSSPGMNRQRLPSTATMQPAGMAALQLGQQIGAP